MQMFTSGDFHLLVRAVVYICNFARKTADLRARQMKLFFVEE